MNRRAFVQALCATPLAAVLPKGNVPDVVPTVTGVTTGSGAQYALAYFARDAKARPGRELTITLKADTRQFTAAIAETRRHLRKAMR